MIATGFPNLTGHRYMNLITVRASGDAVSTPIWFAAQGATLYAVTRLESGKVKRMRHTPQVTVAPCTRTGEILGDALPGVARLIATSDPEAQIADALLAAKYGPEMRRRMAQKPEIARVYLAITRET